ncbi:Nucleotide-sugar transporter domain containing protein [Elaphomyces granulatus]
MPAEGGKRYLTSTAVFLNEVIKLAISLTMALYEVSKKAPPSMPATSLFFSLSSSVFSGDSWKLAIPASLYTLANSLQYVGLSNLEAATFQVAYQLKVVTTAIFALVVLGRNIAPRRWGTLLILAVGVTLVLLPNGQSEQTSLRDEQAHLYFPRSFEEWKRFGGAAAVNLHKRSATYEGIQEDLMLVEPHLNGAIGLLATTSACIASGLASVYFEKVLKDSFNPTSLWVRNVQLAIYSMFPALFIGVIFLDGEDVAAIGFFGGYNWVVWLTVTIQALGGIATAFSIKYADKVQKNYAAGLSIILSTLASLWLFKLKVTGTFLLGSAIVLSAIYFYDTPVPSTTSSSSLAPDKIRGSVRLPPIRIDDHDKRTERESEPTPLSTIKNFTIKLPTTPLLAEFSALSTSRPASPIQHARTSSTRHPNGSYFSRNPREE